MLAGSVPKLYLLVLVTRLRFNIVHIIPWYITIETVVIWFKFLLASFYMIHAQTNNKKNQQTNRQQKIIEDAFTNLIYIPFFNIECTAMSISFLL